MKVYLIQEYYDDVFCDKSHECIDGKTHTCGKAIRCARIIHEITSNLDHAIKSTINKPNLSYEEFDLK